MLVHVRRPMAWFRHQAWAHTRIATCHSHGRINQSGTEGMGLIDRMRTPVPRVNWRQQLPIADIARHAQRATQVTPMALPLHLEGMIVHVHGPHEWTLLAPLTPGGDDYTFRVTFEHPAAAPFGPPVAVHQRVSIVLTACAAGGGWKARYA